MVNDSRMRLQDMLVAFTNDQHTGKTQIKIWFAQPEEKAQVLTFQVPNPHMSRMEIVALLKTKVEDLTEEVSTGGLDPSEIMKKQSERI